MSEFTKVPKHIEEVLASRRKFLKTSGLLAVSFGAAAAGAVRTDRLGVGPAWRNASVWMRSAATTVGTSTAARTSTA